MDHCWVLQPSLCRPQRGAECVMERTKNLAAFSLSQREVEQLAPLLPSLPNHARGFAILLSDLIE